MALGGKDGVNPQPFLTNKRFLASPNGFLSAHSTSGSGLFIFSASRCN